MLRFKLSLVLLLFAGSAFARSGMWSDTSRVYGVPTLAKSPKGSVILSWTERNTNNVTGFYFAESTDNGKTFSAKKLIHASEQLSGSRLMRPKLLFKKDGTWVAVFSVRGTPAPVAETAASGHNHGPSEGAGHNHNEPKKAAPAKSGRASDLKIMYAWSKSGEKWSVPQPVHKDVSANVVRGFFDATVMKNGEVVVAYLNDIPGKPHSRDLRIVTSSGTAFSEERVIDPFVCDCCNISLLTDARGALNIYFRENDNNVRDIFRMTSLDNGKTFSKGQVLVADNWDINSCPHSGPSSVSGPAGNLITWFSGAPDSPGVRLVNQSGKRYFVIGDPSAKNPYLVGGSPKSAVLLWEQNQFNGSDPVSMIAFRTVNALSSSETQFVANSDNATNATGVISGSDLVVAYEVKNPNNKNSIAISRIAL